jgi:hypothetical protein
MPFIEDEIFNQEEEGAPEDWLAQVFEVERSAPRPFKDFGEDERLPFLVRRSHVVSG